MRELNFDDGRESDCTSTLDNSSQLQIDIGQFFKTQIELLGESAAEGHWRVEPSAFRRGLSMEALCLGRGWQSIKMEHASSRGWQSKWRF